MAELTSVLRSVILQEIKGNDKVVAEFKKEKVAVDNVKKSLKQYSKDKEGAIKTTVKLKSAIGLFGKEIGQTGSVMTKFEDDQLGTVQIMSKQTTILDKNVSGFQKFAHGLRGAEKSLNSFRWAMVNAFFVAGSAALLAAPIVGLTKFGMELELLFKRIEIVTGTTADKARDAIFRLRDNTQFSIQEMGGSFLEFTKQGFSAQEAMEAMPSIVRLATVGFTDLNSAVKIMAQTMHAYGLEASKAEEISNVLTAAANKSAADVETFGLAMSYVSATASQLGITYQETAAALAILTNVGLRESKAGTSLNAALSKLVNPTDEMEDILGSLGVSLFNAQGEFIGLSSAIDELRVATRNMPKEEKLQFFMDVFGKIGARAALAFINTIEQGSGTIKDFTDELDGSNSATDKFADVQKTAAAQSKDAWEDLKVNATSVADPLTKTLSYSLRGWSKFAATINAMNNPGDLNAAKRLIETYTEGERTLIDLGGKIVMVTSERATELEKIKNYYKEIDKELKPLDIEADNIIASRQALDGFNKDLSKLQDMAGEEFAIKFVGDIDKWIGKFTSLMNIGDVKGVDISNITDTSEIQKSISGLEDIREKYINYTSELEKSQMLMNTWNGTIKDSRSNLDGAKATLKEYRDALADVNKEISILSSPRFTGQLEFEKIINNAERYLKKQELAQRGIGDAQKYINDLLGQTNINYEELFDNIESVNSATVTGKDSYEAWRETVMEFIHDTVKSGNELGKNVSSAVTKYATLLLSTSKFGKEQDKQSDKQSDTISNLRDAYDVYYGEMTDEVKFAIKAHEEEESTVFSTAQQVISALQGEWSAQRDYKEMVEESENSVDSLSDALVNATSRYDFYRIEVEKTTASLKDLENQYKSNINTGVGAPGGGGSSSGGGSSGGGNVPPPEIVTPDKYWWYYLDHNSQSRAKRKASSDTIARLMLPGGFDWSGTSNYGYARNSGYKTFAKGGIIDSPTMALMGEAGPEMVVPLSDRGQGRSSSLPGGITIQSVTVNGVSGSPDDFAQEFSKSLRRELRNF